MDRQQIESLHERASDHYVRGEYREALDAWRRVLEIDPEDEKAREGARLSGLLGESEFAESADSAPAAVLGAASLSSDTLAPRLAEIEARIESGDHHEALRCAELLHAERPGDADVLSVLARACAAAGDADRAADATSQLLALTPEYAEAARLLEECRRVSPPESQLGIVELRDQDASLISDAFPELESHSFLDESLNLELDALLPDSAPAATEERGLDLAVATLTSAADPTANVLGKRVADLLAQARAAVQDERFAEAEGFLSRLLVLDEENEDALVLQRQIQGAAHRVEQRAEPPRGGDLEDLTRAGVRHFEKGEFPRAREIFLEVLERQPAHQEALGFLERVDARLAGPRREVIREPAQEKPARGSVWQAPSAEGPTPQGAPPAKTTTPRAEFSLEAEPAAVERAPARRLRLPSVDRRFVVLGGIVLLVVAGGLVASRFVLHRSKAETPSVASEATKAPPRAAKESARVPAGEAAPGQASPAPADSPTNVAETMARAATAVASGDYSAAVVAYNAVLAIDPANAEARQGLLEAGELYRQQKTEVEKLDRAKKIFANGEYESALRLLYRLPEGMVAPVVLGRYKVNGWYNLGVVALRAADCASAVSRFAEALDLDAQDAGVRRGKRLADACAAQPKDRAYYDVVESLPFRRLEE